MKIKTVSMQQSSHKRIMEAIPNRMNDSDILMHLENGKVNWEYVQILKETTQFNDEILSGWLNISIKTFRSYKKPAQEINVSIKEHVLLLLSLIQHGKNIFESIQQFEEWLQKDNFFFNGKAPADFLKTITGIRFVDDRLTAMEYGDNV